MRFFLAALSLLMLAIGLFVMALTNADERIAALLCLLISAVLGTGAAVVGAIRFLGDRLSDAPGLQADPHRYPPSL